MEAIACWRRMRMDGEDFSAVRRMIERTKRNENWVVLAAYRDFGSSVELMGKLWLRQASELME
jgi:hypothetical protein